MVPLLRIFQHGDDVLAMMTESTNSKGVTIVVQHHKHIHSGLTRAVSSSEFTSLEAAHEWFSIKSKKLAEANETS